jgi:hypothetical protein
VTHPVLPRHDDPLFSVWRLAWVAHQLPRDITHLFDTNIFFPLKNTLAYSDAMLLLGVTGAPLIWVGVHPVIVHNVLAIAAFVTAAAAMTPLLAYVTPSRTAQVTAGIIFAFAPYRVAHIVHLELLWTALLPLALLALYRVLEQPSIRRALWFGVAVGLQGLCSLYYVVFLAIWLVAALLLAPLHVTFQWSRQHLAAFVVSVAVAAVLLSPYLVPYSRVRTEVGPRAEHEVQMFSAQLSDYLRPSPHNRLYRSQPMLEQDERSLFIGAVAMTLCAISIVFVRSRTTTAYALLTLFAVDLSLGVNGVAFPLLRSILPILDGFRAPARFGVFALLGVSVLSGLGAARLLASFKSRRKRIAAAVLALALIGEYWAAPISSYEAPLTAGQAHNWLAAQAPTVVAVLPMPRPSQLWGYETVFQYLSMFHWQPMVNGYSGHAPTAYIELIQDAQDFPSDRAVQALRERGVQVVLLHERYADPGQFDQYLYGCHNRAWFSNLLVFRDLGRGRSAVCRLMNADEPQ